MTGVVCKVFSTILSVWIQSQAITYSCNSWTFLAVTCPRNFA